MGIDIRTGGASGLPVLAAADGYISRIKIQMGGYGKALYLSCDDGHTAVYAHLQGFIPEIESLVWNKQWEDSSFYLDMFTETVQFPVEAGQIIGYSGRSGTTIPHLHFEIRKPYSRALNPFARGFVISDSRPPVPLKIALIPLDAESEIDSDCKPQVFTLMKHSNNDSYKLPDTPVICGRVGFSVNCYDKTDYAPNPVAPYRCQLFIEDEELFSSAFDFCAYSSSREVELDRNPYLKRFTGDTYQNLYRSEGSNLPFYSGGGVIDTRIVSSGQKRFTIILEDYYGNQSAIEGCLDFFDFPLIPFPIEISGADRWEQTVIAEKESFEDIKSEFFQDWIRLETAKAVDGVRWLGSKSFELNFTQTRAGFICRIPLNSEMDGFNFLVSPAGNVIESWYISGISPEKGGKITAPDRNWQVYFPKNSVYDTFYAALQIIETAELPGNYEYASPQGYMLEPQWIPLKRPAVLSWRGELSSGQAGIYFYNNGKMTFLGNEIYSMRIEGSCLNLETFAVLYDKIPPSLEILYPSNGAKINSDIKRFTFTAEDTLSGLNYDDMKVMIDGQWTLHEYDAPIKNGFAYIRNGLAPGGHTFSVTAVDNCGNTTEKTVKFYVEQR